MKWDAHKSFGKIFICFIFGLWLLFSLKTSIVKRVSEARSSCVIPLSNLTIKCLNEVKGVLQKGSIRDIKEDIEKIPKEMESDYDVPLIIHFLWVLKPITKIYISNINKFADMNSDYEIILWMDSSSLNNSLQMRSSINQRIKIKNVRDLPFITGDVVQDSYLKKNIGAYVDVLRYEIIYIYGGMYVDIDSYPLKPFRKDIFTKSFVSYTEEPYNNLSNSIFGLHESSAFMLYLLSIIKNISYRKYSSAPLQTGPSIFTTAFLYYNNQAIILIPQKYLVAPKVQDSIVQQTLDHNWM